mgnify:CR=1 FL=1
MPPHAVGENTGKRALEGAHGWGRCVPGYRNGRPEAGWRAGSELEKGRSAASQGVKSASAALAEVHEPLEARPGERGCRTGPQKHPLGTPIHYKQVRGDELDEALDTLLSEAKNKPEAPSKGQ